MKRILRDTFMLAAFMILCVFAVSVIWVGVTDEIKLVLQLFGLSFIISVINTVMDEIISLPMLGSYIAKYFTVTAIVMLYGFIVGWFLRSNFWMAFIYVLAVFLLAYLLDAAKVRNDIMFINSSIKNRREQ